MHLAMQRHEINGPFGSTYGTEARLVLSPAERADVDRFGAAPLELLRWTPRIAGHGPYVVRTGRLIEGISFRSRSLAEIGEFEAELQAAVESLAIWLRKGRASVRPAASIAEDRLPVSPALVA